MPASPPDNESKEERGARVQLYASELLSLQAQHGPDNSSTQPRVLLSVAGRYIRKGNGGGLTLLLHANGLREVNIHLYVICGGFAVPHTKLFETFGSTLRHLLQVADEDSQYRMDEVCALDAVQDGDSGLLNAQDLGALSCGSPIFTISPPIELNDT